jgi:DNA-3-methyladenine glycosylase II
MIALEIAPTPPYDFARILSALYRFEPPDQRATHHDASHYARLLVLDGARVWLRIDGDGTADAPRLRVSAIDIDGTADDAHLTALVQPLVRRMTGADIDWRPCFAALTPAQHAMIAPAIGLRHLGAPTPFEALITSILEQQISLRAAKAAAAWLMRTYGDSTTHNGQTYYAFPTPVRLAPLTTDDLRPTKITVRRMALILQIAREWAQVSALFVAPDVYTALCTIKGVGHWTAAWAALKSGNDYRHIMHNDVVVQAAVQAYYYGGTANGGAPRCTPDEVIAACATFGAWAGVAGYHLLLRRVWEVY